MRSEGSQGGTSSSATRLLSVAAGAAAALALLAGCGGGSSERTGPTPPDRLEVIAEGGDVTRFRVELSCGVADREACAGLIAALASADDPGTCPPTPGDDRRLTVSGTIDGEEVRAVIGRRNACEVAAYDAAARAVGL